MKFSWGGGRKGELRICYFGTYSMEEGYPRNRVIIEGLKKNGVDVVECHEDLWQGTSEKLEGIKDGLAVLKKSLLIIKAYLSLIKKFKNAGNYDALIVGYAGHIDIFLAKLLNLFRKKPLIFDAFLSLYDTAVMDRKIVSPNSLKAKLLWLMDRWSCRMADAVLLDTPAHVDYFVREFRLPAEKFHAIPVGSFIKVHEEPHPHLNPLPEGEEITLRFTKEHDNPLSPQIPPPLMGGGEGEGERRVFSDEHQNEWKDKFNILYFGSYIPLHGVDVILKAAKIIQDELSSFSQIPLNPPPLMGGGEGEGEQRVLAPLPLVPSHEGRGNKERGFIGWNDVVFTLVGTGQLLPAMKELASSLGLKNVIFIERFVSEEELVGYIQQADICLGVFGQTDKAARVIPCKVYNCLAMGKPLITMSSPATKGVLTHRENAILCRAGDPAALSGAILALKNDKILREKIAHNGQEYFEKNFSAGAIGKKVIDVISRVRTGLA